MKKIILISTIIVIMISIIIAITGQELFINTETNQQDQLTKMKYLDKCTSKVPPDSKIIKKSDSTWNKYERLVFFLEPNSIGYICTKYSSSHDNTGFFKIDEIIEINFFSYASVEVPDILDVEPNPIPRGIGSYDVVYIIKPTDTTKAGLYWISFSQLCNALPIVIGFDAHVGASQISVHEGMRSCPIKYFDVDIVGFGGMDMEYKIAAIEP